jgi:hypothetical protein
MKRTLVIVADLGNFKAYKWDGNEFHSTPQLRLIDAFETVDARTKRTNTLTVMEGHSASNGSNPKAPGASSDGEQHGMQLEKRRRLVRQLGTHISELLSQRDIERCFLSAPREINDLLVHQIEPASRLKIERNLPLDLTNLNTQDLIPHFFARE